MPMGWCPRPASQTLSRPPERVSEAGILFRGALSLRIRFCYKILWKRRCSRRNMRQMLTCPGRGEGFVPGFRVRVMGCARGRGRGENGYRITLWSAGALPGEMLEWRGRCGMSVRSGYGRLWVRFPCYRHIVSRYNCYFSEILRNSGELFGD